MADDRTDAADTDASASGVPAGTGTGGEDLTLRVLGLDGVPREPLTYPGAWPQESEVEGDRLSLRGSGARFGDRSLTAVRPAAAQGGGVRRRLPDPDGQGPRHRPGHRRLRPCQPHGLPVRLAGARPGRRAGAVRALARRRAARRVRRERGRVDGIRQPRPRWLPSPDVRVEPGDGAARRVRLRRPPRGPARRHRDPATAPGASSGRRAPTCCADRPGCGSCSG